MLCLAHETARKCAVRCLIQAVCCSIQEIEFFFIMGKKYNERGFSLINVKKDRGKLKKNICEKWKTRTSKVFAGLRRSLWARGNYYRSTETKTIAAGRNLKSWTIFVGFLGHRQKIFQGEGGRSQNFSGGRVTILGGIWHPITTLSLRPLSFT